MNFQPLGRSELSDCGRYFVTRAFGSELWEAWLQHTDGIPNERIGKHLSSSAAARTFCEKHLASQQNTGASDHVGNARANR